MNELEKKELIEKLKQAAKEVAKNVGEHLKIEINVNLERDSVKVSMTQINL